MTAVVRRLLATATAVVLLASCRVDVTTSVEVEADGSGTIVVEAVADAELVEAAPGLAEDLRTDDLVAAGWEIDGPTPTDDGGLQLVARHDFTGPAEATELLGQINGGQGPFRDLAVTRNVTGDQVTIIVDGSLGLEGGMRAFADRDLVDLVGSAPWADELEERDLNVRDVVGATLVIGLPDEEGRVTSVTTGEDGSTEAVVVTMAADGEATPVSVRSEIDLSSDTRSPVLAVFAALALVAWLGLSISFAVYVLRARQRRATRRLRTLDTRR